MAEKLFQHYTKSNSDIKAISAGTGAWPGFKMSSESEKLLICEGIGPSDFRSQQLTEDLIDGCDLILVMGRNHLDYISSFFPKAVSRTFLLKSYVEGNTLNPEIADPIMKDSCAYEKCFREIKEAVLKLKKKLEDRNWKLGD